MVTSDRRFSRWYSNTYEFTRYEIAKYENNIASGNLKVNDIFAYHSETAPELASPSPCELSVVIERIGVAELPIPSKVVSDSENPAWTIALVFLFVFFVILSGALLAAHLDWAFELTIVVTIAVLVYILYKYGKPSHTKGMYDHLI